MYRTVIINIRGGVASPVEIPDGIQVLVRDFDTDGVNTEDLETNDDGETYIENVLEI